MGEEKLDSRAKVLAEKQKDHDAIQQARASGKAPVSPVVEEKPEVIETASEPVAEEPAPEEKKKKKIH